MANDLTPQIKAALAQLDPSDNTHWTNDGLPNTGVVQRIANDQTIRRQDIQAAQPGFDRTVAVTGGETTPPADFEDASQTAPAKADGGTTLKPVEAKASVTAPPAPAAQSDLVEVSDDQLHAALSKQVKDAEVAVEAGRKMEAEGKRSTDEALQALTKARANFHKFFPPTTQAENTRAYLDASNAERAARVAARGSASQFDAARRGGNARGWNGQAQSRGPGGARAFSRKEAASLGFVVPGSTAAEGRPTPTPRGVRA